MKYGQKKMKRAGERAVDYFVRKQANRRYLLDEAKKAIARLPKDLWEDLFFEMLCQVEETIAKEKGWVSDNTLPPSQTPHSEGGDAACQCPEKGSQALCDGPDTDSTSVDRAT
jgi:hypothetical protein